jgi:hypothetical protein
MRKYDQDCSDANDQCQSYSAFSRDDHAADLFDTDRECNIKRVAGQRKLDADADTGRDNLYGQRDDLYGDRVTGKYNVYVHSNQFE